MNRLTIALATINPWRALLAFWLAAGACAASYGAPPALPAAVDSWVAKYYYAGSGQFDATVSGNQVAATGLKVVRWESSDGDVPFIQATAANQPIYDAERNLVCFPEGVTAHMAATKSGNRNDFFFAMICEITPTRRPWSGTQLAGFPNDATAQVDLLGADPSIFLSYGGGNDAAVPGRLSLFANGFQHSQVYIPSSRCLIGFSGSGSGYSFHLNERTVPASASSSVAFTSLMLGNSGANRGLHANVRAVFVADDPPTAAQYAELWQFAKGEGCVDLTLPRATAIADGDSMTSGLSSTRNNAWFSRVMERHADVAAYNVAQASAHVQTHDTYGSRVDAVRNARTANLLLFWMGTNNIASSESGETVHNRVIAYCQDRRLVFTGADDSIVLATMLPRAGSTPGRADFNSRMRADFSTPTPFGPLVFAANPGVTYADYLVDLAANPLIGEAGDYADLTYYSADQVHPNDLGHQVIAGMFQPLVDFKLARPGEYTAADRFMSDEIWQRIFREGALPPAEAGEPGGLLVAGNNAPTVFETLATSGAFSINGTEMRAQTGDSFLRIGAPTGASLSVDLLGIASSSSTAATNSTTAASQATIAANQTTPEAIGQAVEGATIAPIPVNQVAVPESRTWILEATSLGLVGDFPKGLKVGDSQVFALDFRNDLATNGRVIDLLSVVIVSVDGEAAEEGEAGVTWSLEDPEDAGVDKMQAKLRLTGVEPGTYVLDVKPRYGQQDGGGEPTARVTLVVVE